VLDNRRRTLSISVAKVLTRDLGKRINDEACAVHQGSACRQQGDTAGRESGKTPCSGVRSERTGSAVMKEHGIEARGKRKFVVTTDRKLTCRSRQTAQSQRQPDTPDVYGLATSPIQTDEGWLYLAIVLSLYSRQYRLEHANPCGPTVWMRWDGMDRNDRAGLIFHSDRGSSIAATHSSKRWLKRLRSSMSRKGNCYRTTRQRKACGVVEGGFDCTACGLKHGAGDGRGD
jgi:transposase InsO family protein